MTRDRSTEEAKKRLRREMTARRDALSAEYRGLADRSIREKLLSSPAYRRAGSVFLYVSMPGEPDTRAILERALKDGKRVYVPKCVSSGIMRAVRITSLAELKPGAYGIPEPEGEGETASPGALDLILVPCVAASLKGDRLGHGAGFYDRFLAQAPENAVCLCYKALLRDDIPVSPLDVPLPLVITD